MIQSNPINLTLHGHVVCISQSKLGSTASQHHNTSTADLHLRRHHHPRHDISRNCLHSSREMIDEQNPGNSDEMTVSLCMIYDPNF